MQAYLEKMNLKSFLNWRTLKWAAGIGGFIALCILIYAFIFYIRATKNLPSVDTLAQYKPPVMTRVHAGDGKLIAEYSKEARVFVPIESIPKNLQHAFVAAEDQRFYSHDGFDGRGFMRAMIANVFHVIKGERLEGGSTITQQVAKNFLVGDERNVERKLREIVIARRIEKALDKDHILELYLNEIYFGRRAYGIAAASLKYFDKPMKDLELAEMAYLALLPKGPNNYRLDDPDKKTRAFSRRNYVLGRMVEDGYTTAEAAEDAKAMPLELAERLTGDEYLAAEYFVEEARKQIFSLYGEDELYSGGLSIRTTLDTGLQLAARRALRKGLERYDRRHGYRGPLAQFEDFDDWKTRLANIDIPPDIGNWRVALVLDTAESFANLGFADTVTDEFGDELELSLPDRGTLALEDIEWAGKDLGPGRIGNAPEVMTDAVEAGDVIFVEPKSDKIDETGYYLRQIPQANGGILAMDPHTGRVLALVGGYSFAQSQFNRATQAYRQPGSAFKPFVYAAALDNGYTPASQVLDAPFVIERQDRDCKTEAELEEEALQARLAELRGVAPVQTEGEETEGEASEAPEPCEAFYKPSNYNEGRWYGLSTLRLGIEQSRNAMTVRLANDIGMRPVAHYGRRFGIYDNVRHELAWALGAGETTLMRISAAYSMLVNGGKEVTPTILDRVQDGSGQTIFVHDDERCETCGVDIWEPGMLPPELPDEREQVIDPVTAYQMTFMLKGVVDNGTGRSIRSVGYPLGGKTGTTNDTFDTWFMGFSPDLVAGIYIGYDNPRTLGDRESGGTIAAPIFRDFMTEALKGKDKVPFRIPENVTLSPINRKTGEPSYIGAPDFILEAFRPGTEPRLGDLGSTIRIGGGSDTFFGDGFGRGYDDIDDQGDTYLEDVALEPGDNLEDSVGEESAGNEEVLPDIPPEEEVPAPELEEEDLDDGLY